MISILSIHAGKPVKLSDHRGKEFLSSVKRPSQTSSVQVSFAGFEDDLCEYKDHRTADRAICFFPEENYQSLEKHYGSEFERPSFGENIRLSGYDDSVACIGDQIKIGDVILEVSHPREPCSTVVKATGITDLVKVACKIPTTGFLARVKKTGTVSVDSKIELISRPYPGFSIHFLNETLYQYYVDKLRVESVLEIDFLADNWKHSLRKRQKVAAKA